MSTKNINVNKLKSNYFEKGEFALHDVFQEVLVMDFIRGLEFVPFCFEVIFYLQKENILDKVFDTAIED